MQTPIAPPYAEALSLLENKGAGSSALVFDYFTDFNETDINIAIENESASWIAKLKKISIKEEKDKKKGAELNTIAKTAEDENKEEEAIDALQNLYMSEEATNIDNTFMQ